MRRAAGDSRRGTRGGCGLLLDCCRDTRAGLRTAGGWLELAGGVPDVFFPQTSNWMVAFWLIFVVLLAGVGVFLFFYRQNQTRQREMKELMQRPTVKEYEDLRREFVQEQSRSEQEKERLLQEMEQEKLTAQSEYANLLHSREWDKMMRHAVTVHLDPETANGNLEVSDDRTRVCDPGRCHDVIDSPARFDRYPFLLGTDFFEKGKHYWEVSVEGCTNWDLGVVRKSVNRKGKITLCPEQGFWCFGLFWDSYEAKDKTNIEVCLKEKPTHVGVFLNLDKGNVSFYDADTKQQLFVFQANFQEHVYPFFSPWRSREPLQIVPVKLED